MISSPGRLRRHRAFLPVYMMHHVQPEFRVFFIFRRVGRRNIKVDSRGTFTGARVETVAGS